MRFIPNQRRLVAGRALDHGSWPKVRFKFWLVLGAALILLILPTDRATATDGMTTNLPSFVDLRPAFEKWRLPIRSQGSRGTCSVFAMTGAIEFALASEYQMGTVLSVEFLNWASDEATTNLSDGGFFSDLWKGYERYGICTETDLPYGAHFDAHLHPDDQVLKHAKAALKTHLHLEWIKPWDVTTGLTDAEFQAIKHTLADGWPVCGGFRWPKHASWKQHVLQMVEPAEVFDGHSLLLVGYKDDPLQPGGGIFLIRNTGAGPADGALPYDYARNYLNDAAWIEPTAGKSR